MRTFLGSLDWEPLRTAIQKYDSLRMLRVMAVIEKNVNIPGFLELFEEMVTRRLLNLKSRVPSVRVAEGHEITSHKYIENLQFMF